MKRMIALLLVLVSTALAAEEKAATDPWALAAAGDYRGVKEALDAYPTLIRMSDDKGFTLLHAAVKGKQLRVAKLLISRGAFVNAVDARQYTPLLVAADMGDDYCARLLIKNGANANARALEGVTAMHIATLGNYLKIVILLQQAGANINAENEAGKTSLMLAEEHGRKEIARFLRSKHAIR
jgi:uncharacterized protein